VDTASKGMSKFTHSVGAMAQLTYFRVLAGEALDSSDGRANVGGVLRTAMLSVNRHGVTARSAPTLDRFQNTRHSNCE
jgi:hypothetical protein